MSEKVGRLRRAWEWLWRGRVLRELKPQRLQPSARAPFQAARACQTLAWRALAGVEPIPAATRDAVARPLVLAGLTHCLPLTGRANIDELLADPVWREHLQRGGLTSEQLPLLREWLETERPASSEAAHGLQALSAVLEGLQGPAERVRAIWLRRTLLLAVAALGLAGMVALVLVLLTPHEGPDIAARKPWKVSSAYPGFASSGDKPVNPPEGAFFSTTNEEPNPWWAIDLKKPQRIASATIVNRSDCCLERAHPVVMEVSLDDKTWKEVARRTELFRTWRPSFTPVTARYVRFRALRRTHLHFKDVRLQAPEGK